MIDFLTQSVSPVKSNNKLVSLHFQTIIDTTTLTETNVIWMLVFFNDCYKYWLIDLFIDLFLSSHW